MITTEENIKLFKGILSKGVYTQLLEDATLMDEFVKWADSISAAWISWSWLSMRGYYDINKEHEKDLAIFIEKVYDAKKNLANSGYDFKY